MNHRLGDQGGGDEDEGKDEGEQQTTPALTAATTIYTTILVEITDITLDAMVKAPVEDVVGVVTNFKQAPMTGHIPGDDACTLDNLQQEEACASYGDGDEANHYRMLLVKLGDYQTQVNERLATKMDTQVSETSSFPLFMSIVMEDTGTLPLASGYQLDIYVQPSHGASLSSTNITLSAQGKYNGPAEKQDEFINSIDSLYTSWLRNIDRQAR